ncbi:sulfatase [Actinobacteria bacterium OK074]|nr:sulfatase [Actinobacteria bacterium OK074]
MSAQQTLTVRDLPDPPSGARNLMLIVLDSLRYDSWIAAAPKHLGRIGEVQQRYAYATWTPPSHYNLLTGLLPHSRPGGEMPAAEYFKNEFLAFGERLQVDVADIQRGLLPSLFLPTLFRSLGYHTRALVSMSVLNRHTAINRDFESYDRMKRHNDMASMLDLLEFDPRRPTFYLLNIGETHYPYAVPGDDARNWPYLAGVHGAVRGLTAVADEMGGPRVLSTEEMNEARHRQINALSYVDGLFAELFARIPPDTYVIVTADHGELFGEDGQFGHGPVVHEKVLEVPLVEGLVPTGYRAALG